MRFERSRRRPMNRSIPAALAFFALPALGQETQAPTLVEPGVVYADSLGTREQHVYVMELKDGHFVFGSANQITVDVVVKVVAPTGEEMGTFDGPARGEELFQFTTRTAGWHRFEVRPFEEGAGRFEFTLRRVEPIATTPEGKVEQLMARYADEDTPGGVVAVVRNGKLEFARAYGMANLTYGIPMTVDTRNNIGSTSKQFTAFAILLLAEQGRLSLDNDIRDYIEELPDLGETVTIRHLLTHTSGYREFLNTLAMGGRMIVLAEGDYIDRGELIQIVQRQQELQNVPGAEWNYNNTAFGLLAVVVERLTDEPFADWMRKYVFEPVGMHDTFVRPHPNFVIPHSATNYGPDPSGGFRQRDDLPAAMGAGGIYSTVGDLAKWMHNLLTGQYGGRELVEQMTTRFVLTNGDTTDYGLGLFIDEFRGLKRIHHGGADIAHRQGAGARFMRSEFALYPDVGVGIIVHSNDAAFTSAMVTGVTEAFLSDHLRSEEESNEFDITSYDPESFDRYVGRYELEDTPGFVLTFSRRDDSLFTQATGQREVQIYPTSDSTFELRVVEASLTFHRNAQGVVESLTLHQNGDHDAKRLDADAWRPGVEALRAYVGRYYSDELETFWTIAIEDSALVMQHRRLDDIKLKPATKDTFSGNFPIVRAVFMRADDGAVTGFKASNVRTRGVWFAKRD